MLKFNPDTIELRSSNHSLFYDGSLEKFVVVRGTRKHTTILESEDFGIAFEKWLQVTKQDVPPF